jgi:hypothetical protein
MKGSTVTSLDAKFIDLARDTSTKLEHGDHVVRFEGLHATPEAHSAEIDAELAVFVDDILVGYITPFADDEHGALPLADVRDDGFTTPKTFHTVEGALEQLIPGAADGLATPALNPGP